MSEIKAEWLGSTRYKNSLIMQDRRVEMLRMGKEPVLLGCEHEAVITLGRRANEESELKKVVKI